MALEACGSRPCASMPFGLRPPPFRWPLPFRPPFRPPRLLATLRTSVSPRLPLSYNYRNTYLSPSLPLPLPPYQSPSSSTKTSAHVHTPSEPGPQHSWPSRFKGRGKAQGASLSSSGETLLETRRRGDQVLHGNCRKSAAGKRRPEDDKGGVRPTGRARCRHGSRGRSGGKSGQSTLALVAL